MRETWGFYFQPHEGAPEYERRVTVRRMNPLRLGMALYEALREGRRFRRGALVMVRYFGEDLSVLEWRPQSTTTEIET